MMTCHWPNPTKPRFHVVVIGITRWRQWLTDGIAVLIATAQIQGVTTNGFLSFLDKLDILLQLQGAVLPQKPAAGEFHGMGSTALGHGLASTARPDLVARRPAVRIACVCAEATVVQLNTVVQVKGCAEELLPQKLHSDLWGAGHLPAALPAGRLFEAVDCLWSALAVVGARESKNASQQAGPTGWSKNCHCMCPGSQQMTSS